MTPRTVPESCGDCRYFIPGQRVSTEPHDGTCHAYPPGNYNTPHPDNDDTPPEPDEHGYTTLVTIHDTTYTGWPIVRRTDWCGTFEPHKRTRKATT